MKVQKQHTGFAIAIAWPETWCKQPGAWYDDFIMQIGISKNHYYKVGHAALVLVDSKINKCHYFDFGRYHTPFQHGRVRSEKTDDALKINTCAQISADGQLIENFEAILIELQQNLECHGEGKIHASYGLINFKKAFSKAMQMQQTSPIPYGPFMPKGSNCSRFVNTVIRAGNPTRTAALKLNIIVPLTPTPINNVNAFENKTVLPKLLATPAFSPAPVTDKGVFSSTLNEPIREVGIPSTAEWLSGEGAGSWFSISQFETYKYAISRYGPDGKLECEGIFGIDKNQSFNINQHFQFDYLSHCQKVSIKQNGKLIKFYRLKDTDSEIENVSIKAGHLKEEEVPVM